jgi:hypothetical protein
MKHLSFFALAAALAAACPQVAVAASYYQVASTTGGDGYYVDVDSESRPKGYVRINMFERKHYGEMVISMLRTMEFDCSGRRSREIKSMQFDADGEKIGESVAMHGFSNDVPDDEKLVMEQVRGDHALGQPLEGMILDFACGSTEFRERHSFVGNLP